MPLKRKHAEQFAEQRRLQNFRELESETAKPFSTFDLSKAGSCALREKEAAAAARERLKAKRRR